MGAYAASLEGSLRPATVVDGEAAAGAVEDEHVEEEGLEAEEDGEAEVRGATVLAILDGTTGARRGREAMMGRAMARRAPSPKDMLGRIIGVVPRSDKQRESWKRRGGWRRMDGVCCRAMWMDDRMRRRRRRLEPILVPAKAAAVSFAHASQEAGIAACPWIHLGELANHHSPVSLCHAKTPASRSCPKQRSALRDP